MEREDFAQFERLFIKHGCFCVWTANFCPNDRMGLKELQYGTFRKFLKTKDMIENLKKIFNFILRSEPEVYSGLVDHFYS